MFFKFKVEKERHSSDTSGPDDEPDANNED